MIRAEGLDLKIGRRRVLHSVSLQVGAGEVVVVTGANGTGKSLLAQALVGLVPAEGRVLIDGIAVQRPPARRRAGYLPQGAPLYAHLSALENLHLFAALARVPWRRRRTVCLDLLELVGLSALADAAPAALSPGQRQRLAVGRALVGDPLALILDEPLTGLDAEGRQEVGHLVGELARMGKAVLIVAGDPEGLPCHRLLRLQDGQLVGGESA